MPKFSYFQQIVNRTKIASDRPIAELPTLNPTRSLFRQWEVNQPLVGDEASLGEERSVTPTVESTVPSVLESTPVANPASTRRPENPPVSHLAASPTLTPMPSPPTPKRAEAKTFLEDADAIAFPLTPKVPQTITPLNSPPADLPPQPSLPKAVSTKVIQGASGISESLHGEQQGEPQQLVAPLSKESDRPTIGPIPVLSPPLPERLSQQVSAPDIPPQPKSVSHPLKTTLESPPVTKSVRKTEISDIPHRLGEPENGSQKRQKNTVHIGSIDVHIMPPTVPPAQPTKPVVKSPPSPLSRGFTSSFGLRQG